MKNRYTGALRFAVLVAVSLAACAGSNQEMQQRMARWEEETREEVEALKRAVEASYDRERAMAERLRHTEDANAQLRLEIEALRSSSTALQAQLDTLQTPAPAESQPRVFRTEDFDVLRVYREALDHYRDRQYDAALGQFTEILSVDPYSEWADNAQYWKGESYYGLGKYHQALTEFTKVFAYRKTEKADDAQLKIARCYLALGEKDKALQAFQKLLDEYPESEYLEAARKEMRYLGHP